MAVLPPDPVFTMRNITMGPVHSLCFHFPGDGTERILAGTQDGNVCTWDLKTNRQNHKLSVGPTSILSVHHTDDSLFTQEKEGTIKLWKMTESNYVLHDTFQSDYCGFCKCIVSETDKTIIRPQRDAKIELLTLNGELITTLAPESDSKLGETMCYKTLEITGKKYLLAAYESGDMFLWDVSTSKIVSKLKMRDCPLTVDYDLTTGRGIYGNASENIQVFNISRSDLSMTLKCEIILKNPGVNALKIRHDGKVFMSAGWDGMLRVYSWKSLRPLAVLTEHKAALQDVCYSDRPISLWRSPIMAAAGLDSTISLWDIYN